MPPKKGRRSRAPQTPASGASSGRSSPAPALLDVGARAGTPDAAQRVLERATPFFARGRDDEPLAASVTRSDAGEDVFAQLAPPLTYEDELGRPSPLELSPHPPPPALGDLIQVDSDVDVEVDEGAADLGHTRAPMMPTYVLCPTSINPLPSSP
jgi:hypothetical protein